MIRTGQFRTERAFTIVEVLVATAVLALLVVMLANLFENISGAWRRSSEKMDNFLKGRALVDAIQRDLSTAEIRQDVPAFPNDQFAFYTREFNQTNASGDMRALAWVAYTNTGFGMVCTGYPYSLIATPAAPVWNSNTFGTNAPPAPALPANGVATPLCDGIYGFAWNFIRSDGTCTNSYYDTTGTNPTRAVRISLLIVSTQADGLLRKLGQQSQLSSDIGLMTNGSTKEAWDATLSSSAWAAQHHYSPVVLSGIRTYERIIPLDSSHPFIGE